jgi:hypothetical protein
MDRAKSSFLQIRVTAEDRARIDAAAAQNFLDSSTWARTVLLRAVAAAEEQPRELLRGVGAKPQPTPPRRGGKSK